MPEQTDLPNGPDNPSSTLKPMRSPVPPMAVQSPGLAAKAMTTSDTYYVSFSAEINPHTTESLLSVMANLVNQRVKAVHLLLSTPGGRVMNGLNIYNVLIGLPIELVTHNVGNVDSIGNAIFLAGHEPSQVQIGFTVIVKAL